MPAGLVKDDNMRTGARQGRKRRRFRYSNCGIPTVVEDELPDGDENPSDAPVDRIAPSDRIVVRLDTPRSFATHEGMIYVSVEITYSNNKGAIDTRGLFVRPYDLTIEDDARVPGKVQTHVML